MSPDVVSSELQIELEALILQRVGCRISNGHRMVILPLIGRWIVSDRSSTTFIMMEQPDKGPLLAI
jgi:hypothetical protein